MLTTNSRNEIATFGNYVVAVKSEESYGQFFESDATDSDSIDDCGKSTTTALCRKLSKLASTCPSFIQRRETGSCLKTKHETIKGLSRSELRKNS